jgi:hypothetical protein
VQPDGRLVGVVTPLQVLQHVLLKDALVQELLYFGQRYSLSMQLLLGGDVVIRVGFAIVFLIQFLK